MIKADNIFKKYKVGETIINALNGVSLELQKGEFLSIGGRSGSGKSTLLYQLSLLDDPTSGDIVINGRLTNDFYENEKTSFRLNNFGFVFQDYALLPELTAKENVLLPLLMQKSDKKEMMGMVNRALNKVGLYDRKDNLPSQLSGGQQQRVSIARAIVNNPEVIFADEPTANLDTQTSQTIIDLFVSLNKEGQSIVLVTHEDEYAQLADKKIFLLDGKIIKPED